MQKPKVLCFVDNRPFLPITFRSRCCGRARKAAIRCIGDSHASCATGRAGQNTISPQLRQSPLPFWINGAIKTQ